MEYILNLINKIKWDKRLKAKDYSIVYTDRIEDKYKEIITNEFFPKRGYGKARLSVAKKAINDFKKISDKFSLIVEIMLHYVEQGVDFTDQYGDIDSPFYDSIKKKCLKRHFG